MADTKPPYAPVLDFTQQAEWSDEQEKVRPFYAREQPRLTASQILLGPYDYLLSYPGKDIRKQLMAAFNEWLQVPADVLAVISNVVGMLHTASLLCAAAPRPPCGARR